MTDHEPPEPGAVFHLPQSVTIRTVAEIHRNLVSAMGAGVAAIDASALTEADMTLFQMLAGARISAARSGRPLNIIWPDDGRVRVMLSISGLAAQLT